MNQHSVQRAYLKSFADKSGKIWVYSKTGGRPIPRSPRQCAAKEDFQSTELELYQNKFIETPGIKALRVDGSLSQSEFEQSSMWMALHILRSPTARAELFESKEDYEKRLLSELQIERLFADYYRHAYTHVVAEPDFVITSDNPVIEFTCADFLMRACAISPQKLIFFSPRAGKFEHELSMHDFFNAMMFGGPSEHLYSHRNDVLVERLAEFAHAYGLQAVIEDIGFSVSNVNEI
jgi:Protein of unknown function (DUF4238)